MKDISLHCSDLSKFLANMDLLKWESQYEWLQIASGIVSVQLDITRYNDCYMCGTEFDGAQEELLEKYVTEFTRFTYVWGALESLYEELNPPPAPERGKINAICYYLNTQLRQHDIIQPYPKLLKDLEYVLMNSDVKEPEVIKRFNCPSYISKQGLGLYVIYKLRNMFVHGTIGFPMPDEDNRPVSMYPELVLLATRIVLITLQMIWLTYYAGKNYSCTVSWESDEQYEDREYEVEGILHNIHWKNPNYGYYQLSLF